MLLLLLVMLLQLLVMLLWLLMLLQLLKLLMSPRQLGVIQRDELSSFSLLIIFSCCDV
jgi:hypothetical protein